MTKNGLKLGLGPVCATLFVLALGAQQLLTPTGVASGYMTDARKARPAAALSTAGKEFRIVAANVLWLDVADHYHHQYMASGGSWATNRDLLPILHMIVTLDPHFTEAYDVGSLILGELGRLDEAAAFLRQGTKNNPDSWVLPYDLAMNYAWYRKDPVHAMPYALQARQIAKDPFDRKRLDIFLRTLKLETEFQNRQKSKTVAPHPINAAAKTTSRDREA